MLWPMKRMNSSCRNSNFASIAPFLNLDTLHTASEIINSSRVIESADVLADTEISFSTDDLSKRPYWIYGFDRYGIVSGPLTVQSGMHGIYYIAISALNGQLLYNERMEGITQQIDLSSLQEGVYIISVRSERSITNRKIIKL